MSKQIGVHITSRIHEKRILTSKRYQSGILPILNSEYMYCEMCNCSSPLLTIMAATYNTPVTTTAVELIVFGYK